MCAFAFLPAPVVHGAALLNHLIGIPSSERMHNLTWLEEAVVHGFRSSHPFGALALFLQEGGGGECPA